MCECTIKFSTLGGQGISHHAKASKHLENCRQKLDPFQLRLERGRPANTAGAGASGAPSPSASGSATNTPVLAKVQLYSARRKSVSSEFFSALKCVASDYSAASCDGIKDLFNVMFEGSPQLENFSMGRTKFTYVLQYGLAPYFRDKLKDDLSGQYYSVYFDETTNDGAAKELRTGVRYWSEHDQRIVSAYLRTFFIGKATGDVISENIVSAIDKYSLPLNKLIMLGSDGPTVNTKVLRLINEKVKELRDKPLVDIGSCNIHIAHNSFSRGLETFGDLVSEFVILVFDFFDNWPSRWEDFEKIQTELKLENHRFIKHVPSRWLTLDPAVDRLLEQWPALTKYFVKFIPTEKPKFMEKAGYIKIKKHLSTPTARAAMVFVRDSARIFATFTGTFQKEQPLIHVLHSELRTVALTILNRVCKPAVIQSRGVCLGSLKPENLLPAEMVDLGENVRAELQVKKVYEAMTDKDRLIFRQNARDHFVAAARNLLEKSALKGGSNVRYYRCLQPQERLSTRSCNDIMTIAKDLPVIVDHTKLLDEWKLLQLEKDKPGSAEEDIDVYWRQFFQMKRPTGKDPKYPNVTAVVKAALCLSHGQGDVERGFSESGRTLTPNRASMSEKTLDAYMVTKNALRKYHNKPHLVPITSELLVSVEGAYAKYKASVEDDKKKEEKEQKEKEDKEREELQETERNEELQKRRKRILDEEQKLKNEQTEETKKRRSGLKLLEEGSQRLKSAVERNDLEDASMAQLMIEAAKNAQTEAEVKRKEVTSMQKTI